jgi:hypothetical protein
MTRSHAMWKVVVGTVWSALAIFGGISVAMAYDVGNVPHSGTIAGAVVFQGDPPAPKVFEVKKDPDLCGTERRLSEVAVRNGRLKGAIVVLEGVAKGKPFADQQFAEGPPDEGEFRYAEGETLALEILTKRCNFGPPTGVVAPDQPIRFVNQDPVKHTLHTYAAIGRQGLVLRTIHNRDISPRSTVERTFQTRKLKGSRVVRITCDRHSFMQNWLYVVETPYFAVSDEDGRFTIDHVPPGRYELTAWHPVLGLKRQDVTVAVDDTVDADFEFSR